MMSRKDRRKHVKAAVGKQRFWQKKWFKWTFWLLLLLFVGVLAVYAYSFNDFVENINKQKGPHANKPVETEEWTGTDPVNIVLLGVDNREDDEHPRSDSMMVVSIDPLTKQAKVMSVMRDTWYKIPDGYGFEKINGAHALGGPDLTIRTLKDMLQIPIHYYVKTDFQGFIGIVDALGGVTIDVEKDLYYKDDGTYDIHLNKGLQRLDGKQSLMYVRFRHDAMSDFARTERQRKFLAAVADEMSSGMTIIKLPKLLDAIEPYMETNIKAADMFKLGKLALEVDASNIDTLQVPPMDTFRDGIAGGGQSVLIPNVFEMRKAVYEFLGKDVTLIEEDPSVQPPEYYAPTPPVMPDNPNVEPDEPEPKVEDPEGTDPNGEGTGGATTPGAGTGGATTPGTGTGGTTTPGTGAGGTTAPGTGTGGTTTPGTGTGGTTTPGTGTGGTTTPGTGTGGTTTPGTGTGGTTTPGTGTGGTTTPGTGTGGTATPGTGTGGTTPPGTGGTTTPGTGTGTGGTTTQGSTVGSGGIPTTVQ